METPVAQRADACNGANDTLIASDCAREPGDWRAALRAATRSAGELLRQLDIDPATVGIATRAARQFPVLVPPELLAAMESGNPGDPLLRQVLPLLDEDAPQPAGYLADPLLEQGADEAGIIRKYRGRALLVLTGACAVHCRYCFRRHFPYAEASVTPSRWRRQLKALRDDDSLREVILSGGDPLLVGNESLAAVLTDLAGLDRLRALRVHTRLPTVLPSRVDAALCTLLSDFPHPVTVVIHCNHPNELTAGARAALHRLRASGAMLLNQAVLLRGINDRLETLEELGYRLLESGVSPYYLHQLDPVTGAAHFAVGDRRALALHKALRDRLPGHLLPRLVREVPGAASKLPLA